MLDTGWFSVTQFSLNMTGVNIRYFRGWVRLALVVCVVALACLGVILCGRVLMSGASGDQRLRYMPDVAGVFEDEAMFRAVVDLSMDRGSAVAPLAVTYPQDGSVFPPDMSAPSFRWKDETLAVDAWIVDVVLGRERHIYAATLGVTPQPEIDARCLTEQNRMALKVDAGMHTWAPDAEIWAAIKKHSVARDVTVLIHGMDMRADGTWHHASSGQVRMRTSRDPVGAPIFYRDVPLMPSKNEEGVIKPLATEAISLIEWRLRDLSKPESTVVMQDMPTCANCHSFSMDGKTMGMDMDGPQGDKGAYTLVDMAETVVIEEEDVFSWNTFKEKVKNHHTLGLMSQVSPDGQYVISTVNESLFVCNYSDFRFLQTFYPTRGILAVYSRKTGEITRLPGADDPRYVQACPVWSPDGKEIIFMRAAARPAYDAGPLPEKANDPREPAIQYDLYRIPFNGGKGGRAEPLRGASRNGMSNSFAKCSPDGRWIVFVQSRNGMLMRPDSRLYIVPSEGGTAREMNCNTRLMNSWHSWSPNSRWLVFASKANTPFTQMFLTHIDKQGNDSPAILVPNSTAANRAVNIPEFVNIPASGLAKISTPAVDYRRLMEKGNQLALQGRLTEAEAVLLKSLAIRSDYPDTHANLAFVLNARGRHAEAIDHCRKALAAESRFAEAHNNWGNALVKLGRLDEAVARYRSAVECRKHYDLALINLGRTLARLGRYEESVEHFTKAGEAEPDSVEAQTGAGRSLMKLGKLASARERFLVAAKLDSTSFSACSGAGDVCLAMGRLNEATEWYVKALALRPESFAVCSNLGSAYLRMGRFDAAVDAFRRAVAVKANSDSAHHNLATALREKGRVADAISEYRKAINLAPSSQRSRLALAWLLSTTSDVAHRNGAEAIRLAESVLKDAGGRDAAVLEVLAAACAEAGQFDKAVNTMESAIAAIPANADMLTLVDMKRRLKLFRDGKAIRQ